MKKLILFLTLLLPSLAKAQIYGLLQAGRAQLNQKEAASHKVYPAGMMYSAGVGMRRDFLEFEAAFQKFNGLGEMEHDGIKNNLVHEQWSLNLGFNFYFSQRFYARFGYGFHKIHQSLEDQVSAASQEGAIKAYGLKKNILTDGILYGLGFVIWDGTNMSVYTQLENMMMASLNASEWNAALGIKIYGH